MARPYGDLVHETSTTTGTGNLTTASVFGKRTIHAAFGTGDQGADNPIVFISSRSANEWEICPAYKSNSTTLVRGTPIASSNSNNPVNFSAGTKDITNDIPASIQTAVPNDHLAAMAAETIKANLTAGSAKPTDASVAQIIGLLGCLTAINVQVFDSSGTYTPTAGLKSALVIGTGGGGGGGGADGSDASSKAAGAGGAAGGTVIGIFSAAQIGASQAVTIGAAGTAGSDEGGNGGNGGDTLFGSLMTAGGGPGGGGMRTGDQPGPPVTGPTGGTASGGTLNIRGGDGGTSAGGVAGSGALGSTIGGHGGSSFWGGGRAGPSRVTGSTGSTAGQAGLVYGAGGSGAVCNDSTTGAAGGAGAGGVVIVIEFLSG